MAEGSAAPAMRRDAKVIVFRDSESDAFASALRKRSLGATLFCLYSAGTEDIAEKMEVS